MKAARIVKRKFIKDTYRFCSILQWYRKIVLNSDKKKRLDIYIKRLLAVGMINPSDIDKLLEERIRERK